MIRSLFLRTASAALLPLALASCNPYDPGDRAVGGAAIGAASGAAIGAAAGGGHGAALGAAIGAGVGALTGIATTPPPPGYGPPPPGYGPPPPGYGPPPRRYAYRDCGPNGHWVRGYHDYYGRWVRGHCAPNW
jgi:YMGG-like Gly-zipper